MTLTIVITSTDYRPILRVIFLLSGVEEISGIPQNGWPLRTVRHKGESEGFRVCYLEGQGDVVSIFILRIWKGLLPPL